MALIYDKNNNTYSHVGVPFNYQRGNPLPLDNTSVWKSLAEAQEYATSGAVAYIGQILTVIEGEQVFGEWILEKDSSKTPYVDEIILDGEKWVAIKGETQIATILSGNLVTLSAKVDGTNTIIIAQRAVVKPYDVTQYQIIDSSGTLKPIGSTTWQYFASEADAVEYLSSDDAKEGEVVSLSTNTGYDIYKINDLDATTFADGYEKIIAQTDLDNTLENYVTRSEISALEELDEDTVNRLIDITENLDSELSDKADVDDLELSVENLQITINEASAHAYNTAVGYISDICTSISTTIADNYLSVSLSDDIVQVAKSYTDTKISALDYTLTDYETDEGAAVYVINNITQNDGKISAEQKAIRVSENYHALSTHIDGKLATLRDITTTVAKLGNVLNFKGVVTSLPTSEDQLELYSPGDVVVMDGTTTEYVLIEVTDSEGVKSKKWKELGDGSAYIFKNTALSSADLTGNLPALRIEGLTTWQDDVELSASKLCTEISGLEEYIIAQLELSVDNILTGEHDLIDRVELLETSATTHDDQISLLEVSVTDHEGRIDTLEADVSEISGKVDEKIYVADKIANVSGYVETLNIHKVNNEQYAAALKAGIASSDIYIVNDENLDAYGRTITNVAIPTADTDAANKAYVDEAIENAELSIATAEYAGVVKSSGEKNEISVDEYTGIMSVNTITTDKLVDSGVILVLDGGNATGQNSAPTA